MSSLSIGLSGLLVNQRLLDLTGQNITNAGTPNYHRQVGNLAEITTVGSDVGAGVTMTGITREVNQLIEQAVSGNTSDSSGTGTQLDGLNQVQSFLATGDGTLHDSLGDLLNDLETLTSQPNDPTQRQQVLADANAVTSQLNATVNNMQQLQAGLVRPGEHLHLVH